MTRPSLPLCNRIFASIQSASILLLLLMLSGLGNQLFAQVPASGPRYGCRTISHYRWPIRVPQCKIRV